NGVVAPGDRLFGEHLGDGECRAVPVGPTTADHEQRVCPTYRTSVPAVENSLGIHVQHLLGHRRQRQTEIARYGNTDADPALATLVDEGRPQMRDNVHLGVGAWRADAAGSETRRQSGRLLRRPTDWYLGMSIEGPLWRTCLR